MHLIAKFMMWVAVAIILFLATGLIIGMIISAPKHKGPQSENFNGKQFVNPSGVRAQGVGKVLKWMLGREQGHWEKLEKAPIGDRPPPLTHSVRITFINHSSFLLQVDGVNLLTDPVFSERVSPFTWAGPERMRPPGIEFEDLPKIDYVLISHNHYDHLDEPTVKRLNKEFQPTFIVPLGVELWMQDKGIEKVLNLDWWQEIPLPSGLSIASVPAQHFSGRGLLDRDATLWCGYVLKRSKGNIYFAGDTGYDKELFEEIGQLMAPIEISLLPIGAYKPEWFMAPVHISPSEAVQVHLELHSRVSVAMHFGTFPLGDDGQTEPVKALRQALDESGVAREQFWVLQEGEGRLYE